MSKKHYEAFAKMMKEALADSLRTNAQGLGTLPHKMLRNQLLSLAWDMTEIFENDNPRFDEDRFMRACGFTYLPPRDIMSLAARWGV
tara:strand:+ start:210 stop:470 length:261 start_codon:yes stop_codon:yes gene_type:complete